MELKKKFIDYLLETVGKKPSKSEIEEIDKIVKPVYNKIYDKPDKELLITKEAYDNILSRLWGRMVANESTYEEIELFLKYSNITQTSHICSLASGLAVFEFFIAKELARKGKMECMDLSEGMNKKARKLATKLNLKNVNVIDGDISKIPLSTDSQDIVLIRRPGISNDVKWIKVLRESHRILKKNSSSRVIFTVNRDFSKNKDEVKSDFLEAKLKIIAFESFRNGGGSLVEMIVATSN